MLLKNLDESQKLWNGTRLILTTSVPNYNMFLDVLHKLRSAINFVGERPITYEFTKFHFIRN